MKVRSLKKRPNFFYISELEEWRNLRKFLSFFPSLYFPNFAPRKVKSNNLNIRIMEKRMQNGRKSSELFEVVEKDLRGDYGVGGWYEI